MKNIIKSFAAAAIIAVGFSSCIDEITPQSSVVTAQQAANAPGAYDNYVKAITSNLNGSNLYGSTISSYAFDYGYPTFFLMRDVMGNDIAIGEGNNWYATWYECGTGLGPAYAYSQIPWTIYYSWIKNCNTVLSLAGENPDEDKMAGAGIAHTMRAFFYMDLARMFAQKPYTADLEAETVPIVTEKSSLDSLAYNGRATNQVMWDFIISDLDAAEKELADYTSLDIYTPDLSVVYGLKARAHLHRGEWKKAEEYAKLAQSKHKIMSAAEYTSRVDGFNTPNNSWIFGVKFNSDDPAITGNDADTSWGSWMILEVAASGCGYAGSYGGPMYIDRHLYETIPATDARKSCYIDFSLDGMGDADKLAALGNYSDYPEGLLATAAAADKRVGGLSLKFRPKGGALLPSEVENKSRSQYECFTVSVPLMRAEEMKLIEIEAAGMQNEADGINRLVEFAQTRDPEYVYGTHTDSYYTNLSTFQKEVWWQRRVELWGEGFATLDIKRFQAGIIRNYAGTNHNPGYLWNKETTPDWMNLCIVQTEGNYNYSCTNNPTPLRPEGNSPEFVW